MKTSIATFAFLCIGLSPAFTAQHVLFEDGFERDNLDQWTGDVHGPHDGQIVTDPLQPENHVLTFSALDANGNMFTAKPISVADTNQQYVVSFDYLGLAQAGSEPGNLGGFLGVATSVDEWEQGRYWLAGTDPSAINTLIGIELTDDGAWHHYEINITPLLQKADISELHLMVEDWRDIGGIPGDAYFDNIRLVANKRRESKLQLNVTEVTLCWESETNQNYQLQYRSSQTPGGWMDLGAPVAGNGATNCVADHLPIGEPQRFYRVIDAP